MEQTKTGFVKYHLPCPLCKSSDAVSVNADSSAYCFSCMQFIKEYDMETQPITNGKQKYKMNTSTTQSDFVEIVDRNLSENTCRKYGVTVKLDSMGSIINHYYPYHDRQGAKIV